MEVASHVELATLRTLIQTADIVADAKHATLWCLDQLPKLYADFREHYEGRFGDAILRVAQALLKRLGEKGSGEDAGRVSAAVVAQLGSLHERLGLAPLARKPAPTTASGRQKKSA